MTMFGKETILYGRPPRDRHQAWIYRRSPRLVTLLLRAQAKNGRTGVKGLRTGDNDNAAGQASPSLLERRPRAPSLASK